MPSLSQSSPFFVDSDALSLERRMVGLPPARRPPDSRLPNDEPSYTIWDEDLMGRTSLRSGKLIIFDGDDTLWRTQEVYDAAKARFASLLAQRGLGGNNPIAALDRIDAEAVESGGFAVARFVKSMLQTYWSLSTGAASGTDPRIEKEIELLSEPLFGDYLPYSDTHQVLGQLAARFQLVLATKGETNLQGQKITRLGLDRYFDRIYLLDRKTEREYADILSECCVRADEAWAVGNSIRSDINPALALGLRAILIKRPAWHYEEASPSSGDMIVVDSLTQACELIVSRDLDEMPMHAGTERGTS